MNPTLVGYIAILVLLLLIFSRMHIGIAMGLVGFFGFACILDWDKALALLKTVPYTTFASKDMSVIPLFILMGSFGFAAGMSEDLYRAIHKFLGHLKGGLAMATVVACACFAAISGSSLATAATLGRVAMPEMKKYKYHASLATGAIAAGGSIGILIPPSVILIIYGIITEQSIAELFLAGFIPGVLEAVFYILTIIILTKRNPCLGPAGPKFTTREKLASLTKVWEVVVLFVVVIGGIYTGIFTPTEAAGIGAFGTLCFALMRRKMTWEAFKQSLSGTINTTGMLFLIVLGAMILGYFFSVSRLPFELASFVSGLPVNRYVILVLILIVVLLLGCIMDSLAIVLLTIPVFYPIIQELGFHPVWFGIIVVRVTEMGLITPPVGLNVYIIQGITGERMETVFKGVLPFIIADVCEIVLLILIPQLSLFLPGLMSG
jgi:tripartite ATP-independent transporter DctM subunit